MTPKQLSSIAPGLWHPHPPYAYDLDQVKARYTAFSKAFDWPKLKICYAMKANYNPDLLRTLCRAGSGIDAVSPGDVYMALAVGFHPEDIIYTGQQYDRPGDGRSHGPRYN